VGDWAGVVALARELEQLGRDVPGAAELGKTTAALCPHRAAGTDLHKDPCC